MVDGEDDAAQTGSDGFGHVPVLLDRAVELLGPAIEGAGPGGAGAVYIDATLGWVDTPNISCASFPGSGW